MKNMKLFRAIGEVDSRYVEEAARPVRKMVWMPIVAAAACVALTVGLWQGGVFGSEKLPVEAPNESATTEVAAPTDTDVVTEPTDEPDADATTDGTADTTTDTQHPDTTKPTATDKTDPTKNTTTGKDKPTTKPTTGKTKPTTKPTTKTEPTKTTATKTDPTTQTTKIDVSEWPVIVADAPEDFGDTGELPLIRGIISPALEKKMSLYEGEDVLYSVIVEIIGTEDAEAEFWQSYKDLAELRKKYDDALVAYEEEAKRLNPDYPNQETTVWSDKMRECLEYRRTLYDEIRTLENKYRPLFIEKKRDEKIEWLRHAVASEITPLTTDTRYYPFFSHNRESAFFATLTADEIHTFLNHHCYVIRLRHPDGDKEVDLPE